MMVKLLSDIKEAEEKEYGRAGANFGLTNNSDHESYAVLLEELQEASEVFDLVENRLEKFWTMVKSDCGDDEKLQVLKEIEKYAQLLACEAVQVAAMAKKAAVTVCDRNSPPNYRGGGDNAVDGN